MAGTGGGAAAVLGWEGVLGNEPDPPGLCGTSPRPGAGKGTIHPHPQETGGAEGASVLPQLHWLRSERAGSDWACWEQNREEWSQ